MATKPKTAVQTAKEFCKYHLGRDCFAPFTGQDFSAWGAFCYAVELWGRGDHTGREGSLRAMAALLRAAQDKEDIQRAFLQSIPAILDWSHVEEIWPQVIVMADAIPGHRALRQGDVMHNWQAVQA